MRKITQNSKLKTQNYNLMRTQNSKLKTQNYNLKLKSLKLRFYALG